MKYVVMFTRGDWEDSAPEAERQRIYGEIGRWWGELASRGKIVGGHQLQPPETATTVVLSNGRSTIVDGPFMESKEGIGGYGVFDVTDLDEVIALVRTFPSPQSKAEVRPVLER